MAAPVMLRSNFPDLFSADALPVLEELFEASFDQFEPIHEMMYQQHSTEKDIWQSSEMTDLPQFNVVAEGEDFSFKRRKQGASKTLVIKKYGLGASISQEMIEDGKMSEMAGLIRELGRSAAESRIIQAMNVFNNGFSSSETTADGQPVFDTAHTLPSGLTFRNELSTSADLDVTSLESALTDFETQFVSDSGKQLKLMPKWLVVAPANKRNAKELIGSELKANTADNNMNSFKEEGLSVISSPHLTDSDGWFLVSAQDVNGLRQINRTGVETKMAPADTVGFVSDSMLIKSRYRWQIGAIHPYGLYGSPGV